MSASETVAPENSGWIRAGLYLRLVGMIGVVLSAVAVVFIVLTGKPELMLWAVASFLIFSSCGALGLGILLAKVISDRLENKEDDYYSKNVER